MTPTQLKDWIKKVASSTGQTNQTIMRDYMLNKMLEKISASKYQNNFVLKGGFLIQSLYGIDRRATQDIDITLKELSLDEANARTVLHEIFKTPTEEGIDFSDWSVKSIRLEANYPGLRIKGNARLGRLTQPIEMDLTTGDSIYPSPVLYEQRVLLSDKKIILLTYSKEQILAEKMQTLVQRGSINTRAKDLYDLYILSDDTNVINWDDVRNAFERTSYVKRTSNDVSFIENQLGAAIESVQLKNGWKRFIENQDNSYAKSLSYQEIMEYSIKAFELAKILSNNQEQTLLSINREVNDDTV